MKWNRIALAVFACCVSGCVKEDTELTSRVFTYELWVPATVFLGGLFAVPVGWKVRKKIRKLSVCMILAGLIACIAIAPSLYCDKATVDEDQFSLRTGLWGKTSSHQVRYDTLSQVRFVTETKRGRRGRKSTSDFLVCEKKDGTVVKIPASSTLSKAALPAVIERFAAAGVPYIGAGR
ncbi:MAG: hypothetical protein AB8G99_17440 [Planctomycetaceae bacterium]